MRVIKHTLKKITKYKTFEKNRRKNFIDKKILQQGAQMDNVISFIAKTLAFPSVL